MIGHDRGVVVSQCECAADMGPYALCIHACADLMKLGTDNTELT